jgi:(1->4)-alpha-D-glucan 1-alpha-D-glucosylmutase
MPGVPDVYQGTELTEPTLVDPDNRRPVDFGRRSDLLDALDQGETATDPDGHKLRLTSRLLRLRRDRPDLFDASAGYQTLESTSPHVLGFVRGGLATIVTRWPGQLARAGWGAASVDLPEGDWTNVLTEAAVAVNSPTTSVEELLSGLPVAVLVRST